MSGTAGYRCLLVSGLAALVVAVGCGAPPGSADGPRSPTSWGQDPLPVVHRGVAGVEGGLFTMRTDEYDVLFDDGAYFGVRYSYDLGLNLACSLSAGYFRMRSLIPGGEELECYPLRLTVQMGTFFAPTQSRWYIGGGGGYNLTEDYPSEDMVDQWPVDLPPLLDEYTAHAVFGFEFRNRGHLATGVEGGHTWLLDSGADIWTMTGSLSYQF